MMYLSLCFISLFFFLMFSSLLSVSFSMYCMWMI